MPRSNGNTNRKNRRPQRRKGTTPDARALAPVIVRCVTGKTGFPRAVALAKLETYATGDRERRPTRIYQCDHCGVWHLTSEAKVSV